MLDKATISTYFFSLLSIISSLSFNEVFAFLGFVLGLLTFIINWYYKHQNLLIIKKNKQG